VRTPEPAKEHSAIALQPYYFIGQWRLPSDRRLRAFVCSARGTLYLTRVYDDQSDLTFEEISDCHNRIFPDLLRRLQHFSLEVPGLLKELVYTLTSATGGSVRDYASVQQDANGSVDSSRRFGELLVQERVITKAQLEIALRIQAASQSYVPIGHVLLARRLISRKTLTMLLYHYRKRARLGEVLVKAGRITAAQLDEGLEYQRGTSVPIGQVFIRLGWLSETAMRDALCTQLHVNFVDIDPIVIDRGLARLVSERFARRHSLVPLLRLDDVVVIAMDDPSQAGIIAGVESALGLQIEVVTTLTEKLAAAMHRLYSSAGSPEMRPISGGNIIIGPIRDPAVAELVVRASPGASGAAPDRRSGHAPAGGTSSPTTTKRCPSPKLRPASSD
jgi:MshEN domain